MKKNEVFTIENAKVADVKYCYHRAGREGYIKEGEGIMYVKVQRVTINLKTQEIVSILVDKNGMEYTRTGLYDMFGSHYGYERSEKVKPCEDYAKQLIRSTAPLFRRDYDWCTVPESTDNEPAYGYVQVWVFEGGEAKPSPVVAHIISETAGSHWDITEGSLPDKFWNTKECAFSFNSYKVIDDDGEEFIEDGYNKRLALTEEQQKAVDNLNAAFNKARDAGVMFIWDRDDCSHVEAYNGNEVYCISYGSDDQDNNGLLVAISRAGTVNTDIRFYDYSSCDDYNFAMKQTPHEQKLWKKTHPNEN